MRGGGWFIAAGVMALASSCEEKLPSRPRLLGTMPTKPIENVYGSGTAACADCVDWVWDEDGGFHRARTGWWELPYGRPKPEESSTNGLTLAAPSVMHPWVVLSSRQTEDRTRHLLSVRFGTGGAAQYLDCFQFPNLRFGAASETSVFVWIERNYCGGLNCTGSSLLRVSPDGTFSERCLPPLGPAGISLHPTLPIAVDVSGFVFRLDEPDAGLGRLPLPDRVAFSIRGLREGDQGFLPLDPPRIVVREDRTDGGPGSDYADYVQQDGGEWVRVPSLIASGDFRLASVVEISPGALAVLTVTVKEGGGEWRYRRIVDGEVKFDTVWGMPGLLRIKVGVVDGVVVLFAQVQVKSDAGTVYEWWAWAPEADH
jgi:hypothetical protein